AGWNHRIGNHHVLIKESFEHRCAGTGNRCMSRRIGWMEWATLGECLRQQERTEPAIRLRQSLGLHNRGVKRIARSRYLVPMNQSSKLLRTQITMHQPFLKP